MNLNKLRQDSKAWSDMLAIFEDSEDNILQTLTAELRRQLAIAEAQHRINKLDSAARDSAPAKACSSQLPAGYVKPGIYSALAVTP